MANPKDIYNAARKGFLGHSALLDPDTYVAQIAPMTTDLGPMVATNAAVEPFDRLAGKDIQYLKGVVPPPKAAPGAPLRSQEQADLNEALSKQGIPYAEIMRREQANQK